MSRQNSRDVGGLEVTLNGHQIEIDPIGNGTKTIDDVKVMLLKGQQGDPGLPADMTAIAPAFSSSVSYAVGDLVIYNNKLYKCTTAHSGAWNINDFTQTNVVSEPARSVANALRFRYSTLSPYARVDYNGSSQVELRIATIYAEINATNWSSTPNASGYYTNVVDLPFPINTYWRPIVDVFGVDENTKPTSAEKAAFNLCDDFYFEDGTACETLTVKAKTKPTTTFNISINGFYLL